MERTAAKGELRANLSQGGSGRKITLSEADQETAVKAAKACGLEVAGVDLMKDPEGRTFVIEVNSNYGYQVETITKVDISTPLIEFCERNYKKGRQESTQAAQPFEHMTDEQKYSAADRAAKFLFGKKPPEAEKSIYAEDMKAMEELHEMRKLLKFKL
jgi:hypothetical protein